LIIAALIYAAAALLVAAGIASGISFALAFTIATVVLLVAFVAYDAMERAEAYREEHGPTDNVWTALGVALGIVALAVLGLTGIPQIAPEPSPESYNRCKAESGRCRGSQAEDQLRQGPSSCGEFD
jgi:hypothetical protein